MNRLQKTDRNASSALMGFEYQINVGIFFMFRYLKDIISLEIEGIDQDVELILANKQKIMIQAKSQTVDLNDCSNNMTKLKEALTGLSESDNNEVKSLYYVSNMNNPLNTKINDFHYEGVTEKYYKELSIESQKKIDKQIETIKQKNGDNYDIDRDKLIIMRIPFFGAIDREKHKYIIDEAKTFLSIINDSLTYKGESIVKYCEAKFLNNGSSKKISISKKEFCNWIILIELSSMNLENEFEKLEIDDTDYYDAYMKYQKFIDEKVSTYETYVKVYSLFDKVKRNHSISISDFVKQEKLKLYNYFFKKSLKDDKEIDDSNKLDVYISQIISYAILKRKNTIDKIKKEANL